MMAGQGRRFSRIVVAANAEREPRSGLDLAARLAVATNAELAGLFIEDAVLARWAEHPTVRVVGRVPGGREPEGGALLARALRSRAEAMRRDLAAAAARHRLRSSFAVRRGVTPVEIRHAAREADLVLLAWTGGDRVPPRGRIVVYHDGSPAADRALETACDLSAALHREPAVLLMAEDETRALRGQRQVMEVAGAHGFRPSTQYLPTASPDLTVRAVDLLEAGVLLLPADSPLLDENGGARFLDRVSCPVVVLG